MNIQRTPPRGAATFISGSGSASGSAPDISGVGVEDTYHKMFNSRKRKERCEDQDYKKDFNAFRTDIMKVFEDFAKNQNDTFSNITHQYTEIKEEIKTIKLATENLSTHFQDITDEIKNIKIDNDKTQHKLRDMEKEISEIKSQFSNEETSSQGLILRHENLLSELKDRCDRERNIVIVGLVERANKNSILRRQQDETDAMNTMTSIYEKCPKPVKCMRLGRYTPGKNRPLKIYFNETDTPKNLLRNRSKLPDNVRIYSDKTPIQKQFLQKLKDELKSREENGELELSIKYIKGIPTIIQNRDVKKN